MLTLPNLMLAKASEVSYTCFKGEILLQVFTYLPLEDSQKQEQ